MTPLLDQLHRIHRLASLTHDVGKATLGFDNKLRRYLGKEAGPGTPDPVRHELIGLMMLIPLASRIKETGDWCVFHDQEDVINYFENEASNYLHDCLPRYQAIINACAENEATRHELLSSFRLSDFNLGDIEQHPSLFAWLWLVLTHHKLPENKVNIKTTESGRRRYRALNSSKAVDPRDFEINTELTNYVNPYPNEDISPFFQLLTDREVGLPWRNTMWCDKLRAAMYAMAEPEEAYSTLDLRESSPFISGVLHLARPAVLIGDHLASSLRDIGIQSKKACYANTHAVDDKVVMADPLDVHLLRTVKWSSKIFSTLFYKNSAKTDLPRIPPHEMGVLKSNDAPAPYDWQNHIAELKETIAGDDGLIAMVNAGTGTGKTRGCIKILAECSGDSGLRASLALGLRSLADQGYRDYTEFPIDLPKASVGRLIGSYYPIETQETSPGTSATEHSGDQLLGNDDKAIPHDAFVEFVSRGKNAKLMPSAVTALTIDCFIDAISLHRPSASYLTYHLVQTDIIIDEIDNLSAEDLIFVEVLVYMMGLYGRKVVLASATLNPIIAKAMGEAYLEGFTQHKAIFGHKEGHMAMVSSQAPYYSIEPLSSLSRADAMLERLCSQFNEEKNTRLRPSILDIEQAESFEEVFGQITSSIKNLARAHSVTTELEGVRFSSGFVRFNLVEDAQSFATIFANNRDPFVYTEVICYHSKNTAFERYFIEYHLNHLAKRNKAGLPKELPDDIQAGFNDLLARAKAAGCQTACLVVSTTSLIEVGRDHDYDWAILEPASVASFLQSIGRVLRHRKHAVIPASRHNILVLSHPLSTLRQRQHLWAFPGIESPSPLRENLHYQYMPDYPLSISPPGRITARLQGLGIEINRADETTRTAEEMLGETLFSPSNAIMTKMPARQVDYPEYAMNLLKLADHLLKKGSPLGDKELRAFNGGNYIHEDLVRLQHKLGKKLRFRGDEITRELICLDADGNYSGNWQQISQDFREQDVGPQPYIMRITQAPWSGRFYFSYIEENRKHHLKKYQARFRSLNNDRFSALFFSVSLRAFELDNDVRATAFHPLIGVSGA
jgi:hypothetical protein